MFVFGFGGRPSEAHWDMEKRGTNIVCCATFSEFFS